MGTREAAPTASRDATVYAGGAEIADFAEVLWENASSTADVSTGAESKVEADHSRGFPSTVGGDGRVAFFCVR
eukprot:5485477-Amphidinium_carterae.1